MKSDVPSPREQKPLRLEDIPFDETYPAEAAPPLIRELICHSTENRNAAWHYWVQITLEGFFNSALLQILRRCPSTAVSNFGRYTSTLVRWRYRKRIFTRRISRNFNALTPHLGSNTPATKRGHLRWWSNVGRTLAEFARANDLWPEGNIEVVGEKYLAEAKADGIPPVFVSVHLSTWEAAFTAIHQDLGGPSTGPFQPESSRFTNRIVHELRRRRNQYLFPPGQRSAIWLRKLLAANSASLTIFIDEVRDRQVRMPLLGRPLPEKGNAVVAIKLANVSGGTLLPFYMERVRGPKFRLHFLPPIKREDGRSNYDLKPTLLSLNDVFEPLVLANIEHWYMLSDLRLPPSFETNTASQLHLEKLRTHASVGTLSTDAPHTNHS